jgi:hypothetical protein
LFVTFTEEQEGGIEGFGSEGVEEWEESKDGKVNCCC